MNATKMKEALAARGVDHVDGITDELVARMDWAAGLTDDQLAYLQKGLVLAMHAAEQFGAHADERAITRLADELEALP